MKLSRVLAVAACASFSIVESYSLTSISTKRSTMTMKRGRGSFQKEISGGAGKSPRPGGNEGIGSGRNWINVNKSVKELPTVEGKVQLLDTNAFLLVDKATNPTGAVSVMKYGPQTFCFSVACPQCKIPLTKAQALPPNEETGSAPRLCCEFCKATFNMRTGDPVKAQESSGFLGGLAKAVLSAQETTPLPIYQLGEKNGKIMFSMD